MFFLEIGFKNEIDYNYLLSNYNLFSTDDKLRLKKYLTRRDLETDKYKIKKINNDFLLYIYKNDLIFEFKNILEERKECAKYIKLCENQISILMLEFN